MTRTWTIWLRDLVGAVQANYNAGIGLIFHNSLPDLQGGATGDYYHLTEAERTQALTPTTIPDHNDLEGVQGGASGEYNHLTDEQVAQIGVGGGGGGGVSTCSLPRTDLESSLDADQPHYIMYFHNGSDITVNSMNAFLVDLGHGLPVSPPIPIQLGIYSKAKVRLGYGATTVGAVDSEMIKATLDSPVTLLGGETYFFAILKATAMTYSVKMAENDQTGNMDSRSGFLGNVATTLPATETGSSSYPGMPPFYIGAY
jgi:hypothetical protein